jgi:hypothetical protein
MAQHYSDPRRENDPHALPDIEVFYHAQGNVIEPEEHTDDDGGESALPSGWYWWLCFPGCLPDGEPMGPFETEAEALADARDGIESEED